MRYSTFEQAAAEASYGMKEIDAQLEQLKAQVAQLQGKRDLLATLSSQLLTLRPENTGVAPTEFSRPSNVAEMPRPEQAQPESQPADAEAAARSLRQEWISLGSETGTKPSLDSIIRGRL